MSLIIATGSNQGNSQEILLNAQKILSTHFTFVAASRYYLSAAVDYEAQPDFINQVLEFEIPSKTPSQVMELLLEIEKSLGRVRDISRGPRTLDLDIVFWGTEKISLPNLEIPHPRWEQRSFVVLPLMELPFFQTIEKCFTIPTSFIVNANPL